MRARLINGQIVELAQDCECVTHDGPHWLHMSQVDRLLNYKILPRIQEMEERLKSGDADCHDAAWYEQAVVQLAQAERMRLGALRRKYESLGIVEIMR